MYGGKIRMMQKRGTAMDEAEEIYKQYYDKVYRYVRSKVSDPHETEDLAASVY